MASNGSSGKRVGIIQSNYIPWKGYFDFIDSVDEFILFDTVQYTRRDWRNRNQIKTHNGLTWLTVPVEVKGRYLQNVNEVRIADQSWIDAHLKSLQHAYARAPFFQTEWPSIASAYQECRGESLLSVVNERLLRAMCTRLGISTPIRRADEFAVREGKNERLIDLCLQTHADLYVSGPAAKAYLDEAEFAAHGLRIHYKSYSGYQPYPQMHGEFEHAVSIVDLLFNTGPEARAYLKSSTPFEEETP